MHDASTNEVENAEKGAMVTLGMVLLLSSPILRTFANTKLTT